MKREILFKGKRVDNGEWVFGGYHKHEYVSLCIASEEDRINNTKHLIMVDGFSDWNMQKPIKGNEVHPETVCQFTGLLDKNGNKIFDGDKLECSDIYNDKPYTTTVRFEDGGFLVDAKGCDYNITCIGFLDDEIELEIIGNIHD